MARMVTLWRCKCGTCIKVIAEIDSSPPAKQTASCPKCYALHAVHADRIITITEDTFDLGPPPVPCEEKERLLAAHNKAVNIYSSGALELAQAAGVVAHAKFKFLYDKVLTARQFLLETRQQLNEHTAAHGC